MTEKKNLNNEELDKVSGGGRDGRDGGAIYNNPSTPNNTNAIYGVDTQEPISGSGIGGRDPYDAGPQILTENNQ